MSCYNCYYTRRTNTDVLENVLERGERLKSAMVQSILSNEPIKELPSYDSGNSQRVNLERSINLEKFTIDPDERIKAYLQGDSMSKRDELVALETLRSMSATDLCKITDRTYSSAKICDCATCRAYKNEEFNCDNPVKTVLNSAEKPVRKSEFNLLKYVDSLKVYVHCISLNDAGCKKVVENWIDDRKASVTNTYFVEYQIPDELVREQPRSKSKVDSGLDFGSVVRICSRSTYQREVAFKQSSVHDITNHIDAVNLNEIGLKFRISARCFRQKHPNLLGLARFCFASFLDAKNLICNQELVIKLNEKSPITVGTLKVSIQLGCGRIYFGREFIDSLSQYRENSVISEQEWDEPSSRPPLKSKHPLPPPPLSKSESIAETLEPKQILFGFIYIAEAQFSREVLNSFVTCQLFGQDDVLSSKVVTLSSKPLYNFSQQVPLIYDEELLWRLRENYTIVEFREKDKLKDFTIGLTKLPLHTFYLAFRNRVVLKYLAERKFPIVASDGWEPIYHPTTDELVGQVLALVALGTKEQIDNLEAERGFKQDAVKAKPPSALRRTINSNPAPPLPPHTTSTINNTKTNYNNNNNNNNNNYSRNKERERYPSPIKRLEKPLPPLPTRSPSLPPSPKKVQLPTPRPKPTKLPSKEHPVDFKGSDEVTKLDVATQSEMDSKQPPQDITALLTQLIAQKQLNNTQVDNGTNTEAVPTVAEAEATVATAELRSTSDLLDSLQRALIVEPKDKNTFRVQISVNSALHLPGRRKCKSRKSRSKSGKSEDILPSTYVTFEGRNGELRMTQVVAKNTSPRWDFKCDMSLPIEFLTNANKRLVFKVWRKSTNTTLTPNLQTDMVLGFAALDLTVLTAGLPNVQGWFNIVDFSNKCNGQINIHVNPLEDLSKFHKEEVNIPQPSPDTSPAETADEPVEILGRALKRKFTELDEITQRLRLRLSKVTNDESDTSNDEVADEFERDINTLCVEDDFDMIDFEKEATNFNINHMKDIGLLQTSNGRQQSKVVDRNLMESKQKIDTLLEKLSLVSAENSSRYVSGCSNVDTEAILNELDYESRPSLYSTMSFDKTMKERFPNWETMSDSSEPTLLEGEASKSTTD